MNNHSMGLASSKWTCADLLSSYRFWGICIFFCLLSANYSLSSTYSYYFWQKTLDVDAKTIGLIVSFKQFGFLLGIILSWFLYRLTPRYALYSVALLLLCGTLCIWLVNDASQIICLVAGMLMIGASQGAITILIPAFLAGAVGSISVFAIVFGLLLFIKTLVTTYSFSVTYLIDQENLSITSFIISVIALLLIVPMKKFIFSEPPAKRKSSSQSPQPAQPVVTGLLALIVPFYAIYWFVRIHRELHFFTPSPRLMTAQGAGWLSFLVPLGSAALCMMLSDEICSRLAAKGKETGIKTGWVLFWSLLILPVGIAILQEKANQLMAEGVKAENNDNQ